MLWLINIILTPYMLTLVAVVAMSNVGVDVKTIDAKEVYIMMIQVVISLSLLKKLKELIHG